MRSRNFPWGHRRNESKGVILEERKYSVAHGENIAFGDVHGAGALCNGGMRQRR